MKTDRLRESVALHGRQGPSARGEVRLCCPFCTGSSRFTLSASPNLGVWHCHRCGAAGKGDLSWLPAGGYADELPPFTEVGPPAGFLAFADAAGSRAAEPYRAYLRQRGVLDVAVLAGAGCALDGRYAGRVVVPVLGAGGTWLGFSARAIYRLARPTYLYPPGMRRGRVLFNGLALGSETAEPAFVVEGVFDALHLWPDGVAVLGKPTADQLVLMAEARRPLVVVLDGDAWQEGMALALQLRALGKKAAWLRLSARNDPDENPAEQLRERAREALEAA